MRNSDGLTPLLGWMFGVGFFVLAPFALLTLNNGLELPPIYQIDQNWATVDLADPVFIIPYLVIWALLMLSCLVIYLFMPSLKYDNPEGQQLSRSRLKRAVLITMAIAAAAWAFSIWLAGGLAAFLASHWYVRGEDLVAQYGDAYVWIVHLVTANQIVFTAAAALYTSAGLKHRDTSWRFTLGLVVFFVAGIVMSGNRIFFAVYLLSVIASCLVHRRRKVLATLLALAPVVIFVFSAWSSARHDLTTISDSVAEYAGDDGRYGNQTVTSLVNVTEAMSVMLLMHMINDYGGKFDYLDGLTYSRTFTSLVPRSLYPQKPDNFTLLLAKQYLPGVLTSFNATALGEMYANFGPLTVVLFPLFTFGVVVLTGWAARRQREHSILCSVLFILLVWAARSTFDDTFSTFVMAALLIWLFRMDQGMWVPAEPSGGGRAGAMFRDATALPAF